jgi:hypothetical protein
MSVMMFLDHIGLVGSSITRLREAWIAAGFFVTEPEELMALEAATGQRVSLGQRSCHIVLERGYIELTAVDTVTPKHHLYPWIRDEVSLGIIAIGSDQIEEVHSRFTEARVPVSSIARASRPIHYGARRGDALFSWFSLGASGTPEALVCFVRNERPELIYQTEVQQHPNGARALQSVIIGSNESEITAARYTSYTGSAFVEVAPELVKCPLQESVIWIGTDVALSSYFGKEISIGKGEAPRAVGFSVGPEERIYWIPG